MTGRFYRDGGPLLAEADIRITTDYRRPDGREGWRGEAYFPIDVVVLPGERLRLEPSQGSGTDIVVDRVTVDSRAERILVRFTPVDA